MKIDIETLRQTKGIGSKTLERVIEQHEIDNEIKSFKSKYIPSDKYKTDKDINLWQGDCLELMSHIPDKSVDMILCDLPYGTTACSWDNVIPFKPLWSHYKRIIKDNGAIVLFGSEPFSTKLRMSNLDWYRYDWVWQKDSHTNFLRIKQEPAKRHELVSVFYKHQPIYNPQFWEGKPNNSVGKQVGKEVKREYLGRNFTLEPSIKTNKKYPISIMRFNGEGRGKAVHPTQKPVPLLEYLIKTYTDKDMIVLDNTMGSGSTGVACKNTNRKFIGIELEEKYYRVAKKRIENIE